jgi:hypothetical protein
MISKDLVTRISERELEKRYGNLSEFDRISLDNLYYSYENDEYCRFIYLQMTKTMLVCLVTDKYVELREKISEIANYFNKTCNVETLYKDEYIELGDISDEIYRKNLKLIDKYYLLYAYVRVTLNALTYIMATVTKQGRRKELFVKLHNVFNSFEIDNFIKNRNNKIQNNP